MNWLTRWLAAFMPKKRVFYVDIGSIPEVKLVPRPEMLERVLAQVRQRITSDRVQIVPMQQRIEDVPNEGLYEALDRVVCRDNHGEDEIVRSIESEIEFDLKHLSEGYKLVYRPYELLHHPSSFPDEFRGRYKLRYAKRQMPL